MDKNEFINDLADILEVEPSDIHDEFVLHKGNWNSLSIVSTIVLIDEHFDVAVAGDKLVDCKSVGTLIKFIKEAVAELK